MGIEKIDKNFAAYKPTTMGGKTSYRIPSPYFSLHGVFFDEQANGFLRMDARTALSVSEGVEFLNRHTAGGRLCFSTDSASLEIEVAYKSLDVMPHMPLTGSSGFTLFEATQQGEKFISNLMPAFTDLQGFKAAAGITGGGMKNYVLYFPLYQNVTSLTIVLDDTAKVQKYNPYRNVAPILYYGSSITQGGCASRPDTCYECVVCKRNRIDFINLGFSGNGKAEPNMVDYLAGIDCSLFVCDYDYNAPTSEYLEATHCALYERYRKARPNTPILFISKPDWKRDTGGEDRQRIIRNTYLKARRKGDKNVYFLSGKTFYGKQNPENFAVDGCHPTDYGFALMADKIYKKMLTIDKKFGRENND